ncbi:M15 family metallopeptidase [Nocardioides aquiterrae]|uniref:Peptidase M15C domain-containing protein n=1 Tax=Nocardioides aquiterrae TaxID=203799 RepID=A0ABP4EUQ2_9ACTN
MRLGRALGTTALAGVLVLPVAGCNGGSEAGDPAPSAASTSAASSGQTAAPALDPKHAIDPPGRRTGAIAPADIVVNGAQTIPQDKVDEIRRLKGVQDVEQISLAQLTIENRALSVAAVDPATYRNWVIKAASAQTQVVWNRVAGGELAIRPALEKRAPIDKDGYLALGSTSDAPRVHVGAYAQQSWLVDAVVNDTWIPDLGMTEGNALLIRTGGNAPEPLRKPIEKILEGTDTTVSMTDVVAREGLDPHVVQTVDVVGTVADAVGVFRYTVLSGGHIAPDPAWVKEHIATEPVPILGNVTCNKLIFPQLRAALEDVMAQGLADKIHPGEYAGCYYPRFIAGTTTLSNHAFGLALDLNVPGNQRGSAGEMDRGVVAIFKHWGFTWGGDWKYTDPMHFEMNQLVQPK